MKKYKFVITAAGSKNSSVIINRNVLINMVFAVQVDVTVAK
jgi:prolyl-tRNA editing enzyme YbaK/EbsC (Cys-tRNA(Pro) deacylase)